MKLSAPNALALLLSLGYNVEAPKPNRSGKLVVYILNDVPKSAFYAKSETEWNAMSNYDKSLRTVLANVDWTEGEGLDNDDDLV